jgi:phage shock protein PspC (stress-responsive transcriptional regulator)
MTIPPVPPTSASEAPAARSDRFFSWVAGLGIARSDGWIGGVAAGIAARLRIDPLIVRGVLVVAALFGLPVVFLYAVAWMLLPDADGRIHARDLVHGDFQPVQIGILVTALIGLIPSAPVIGGWIAGLWYNPYGYEQFIGSTWSPLSILGWVLGLALAGILIVLIVRAARRTPGAAASRPSMASTDSAAPGASAGVDGSGAVDASDAIETDAGVLADSAAPASALISAPPVAPDAPSGGHTPDDLAAWRQQHAAWKEQDQAWRRQQQDAERAARDQARRERQAMAANFAVEAAERRRISRESNPRASSAFVASVVGLAIVVGSAAGLWNGGDDRFRIAVGLLAAALVVAVGMVIAGALRRRSGVLAFLAVIVLLGAAVATGATALRQLTFGDASVSNATSVAMQQPFGALSIDLDAHEDSPQSITVHKGSGSTSITVAEGVELELAATVNNASIVWSRVDQTTGTVLDVGTWQGRTNDEGQRVFRETIAAESSPIATQQSVTINQTAGEIHVTVFEGKDNEE